VLLSMLSLKMPFQVCPRQRRLGRCHLAFQMKAEDEQRAWCLHALPGRQFDAAYVMRPLMSLRLVGREIKVLKGFFEFPYVLLFVSLRLPAVAPVDSAI
jgi:hypothetical protein